MSYLGVGVSPGNVPDYHGTDTKAVDRKVRLAELMLRSLVFVLALVAVLLVATDSQIQEIFSIKKKAKFTDMKALVFLVVVNGMAAAYSLVQVLRCGLSMVMGTVLLSKPVAWIILSGDQLRIEQRRGRIFQGWNEGKIYFPPTYKYLTNSDRYTGDNLHHKEKRRTPAWCDRILWYGRGLHQLSYVRGESRFSDHRPVYSLFWAEVELVHSRYRRTMSCSNSRIEVEELLPYANGYTELCLF